MFDFVSANWEAIVAIVSALIVVVDKVAKLTPTTKDDEFVAKVEAALGVIGVK